MTTELPGKRLFVVDAFCGAEPGYSSFRPFITEVACRRILSKHVYSPS
ncbi:hypothetical protein ACNKHL_20570 [Shigella flexneri]